jgi:hypothetical protein
MFPMNFCSKVVAAMSDHVKDECKTRLERVVIIAV